MAGMFRVVSNFGSSKIPISLPLVNFGTDASDEVAATDCSDCTRCFHYMYKYSDAATKQAADWHHLP